MEISTAELIVTPRRVGEAALEFTPALMAEGSPGDLYTRLLSTDVLAALRTVAEFGALEMWSLMAELWRSNAGGEDAADVDSRWLWPGTEIA